MRTGLALGYSGGAVGRLSELFFYVFVLFLFQSRRFGAMWVSHCPNFSEAELAQNAPPPYPVPAFGRYRPLLRALPRVETIPGRSPNESANESNIKILRFNRAFCELMTTYRTIPEPNSAKRVRASFQHNRFDGDQPRIPTAKPKTRRAKSAHPKEETGQAFSWNYQSALQ